MIDSNYEFKIDFFHFYLLNMDISVTINTVDLKCSVCTLKVLNDISVSHFLFRS